ncbi:MAG: hypothetical protein AAB484_02390 [Patescibacteria group bacterium]
MKRFLQFLHSLFVAMFGTKFSSSAVGGIVSVSPVKNENNECSSPVPVKTNVPVIRQRRRLSAIMDVVVLPEVKAEIIGKHQVRCNGNGSGIEGHFKVFGQIGSNGFARIRRFGDASDHPVMVRLVS